MPFNLERPQRPSTAGWRILDFGPTYAASGFVGFIFAASGPLAIVLSVATGAGLPQDQIASWIFGIFFVNGLITVLLSWIYRQPLAFFWTIPGTVLVGPALAHLTFPEVLGAFYATGLLMLLLGLSGWVKRAMRSVPMPVVMGMVAGVFLRFGLDLIRALHAEPAIAAPMVGVFLLLSAAPAIGRFLPPVIGALLAGAAAVVLLDRIDVGLVGAVTLVEPVVQTPAWSLPAMVELVVPLAITVVVVQNGQGFAVLTAAGHEPPINAITVACGLGSLASALTGSVSTCLTGPTNAILTSSGRRDRQYTAAIYTGLLAIGFGLASPALTRLMLGAPKTYIMTLAGLAMLRVLQGAFAAAFRDRFGMGALISFLVTVADIPLLNIGAAFWGLIAGLIASWLLERRDFAAADPPR